jgi:hypothetical protein
MSAESSVTPLELEQHRPYLSRCPGCGGEFECGMQSGRETCWCEEFPTLSEPVAGISCYCPRCLKRAIETGDRSSSDPQST